MHEDVSDIIARRRIDPAGLSRVMSTSIAVHAIAVTLVMVVPRSWFTREQPKPLLMTISLGGSLGERSGGMVAAGARPVEQVAPPPKRPEPIRPAVRPKPDEIAMPVKTPVKTPPPKPVEPATGATSPLPRPVTGTQVQRGTSVADTGATGQGTGLTFGGGAGGALAVTVDSDFCCKAYIEELIRRIGTNWDKLQHESGSTTIVFAKPEVEQTSGSLPLDMASKAAFAKLKLEPLPKEYPSDRLKIHLTFPYVR
jgi:outer membrane biosynthesis protein TonB